MTIERAQAEEIPEIFALLKACGKHMRDHGLFQWNDEYPKRTNVEADVKSGSCYTCKIEHKIAAVISMDENQSPEYGAIPWNSHEAPIFVIHRLAVHPHFQGKGIASIMMDLAEQHAQSNKYASIRLDAYSANNRACGIYRKRGYDYRGDVFFPFRELPFHCFEKIL